MSVNLYYTQRIRGFQQESVKYIGSSVRYSLKRTKFQCHRCGAEKVTIERLGLRRVHGEPMGCCREVIFEFATHRLYCPKCKTRAVEHIPFLSHPWSRMTKALERTVLTFRHISNAKMEGFNNKIRWHIKQAYGFRDREHFKLKIYQLPEISSVKEM